MENVRFLTDKDFFDYLSNLKSQGMKLPDVTYENMVTSQNKAIEVLDDLHIPNNTLLYEIMTYVSFFPIGRGEELYTLDQILNQKKSQFWDEEFPNFSERFLQLNSIEGEGSYFYEIATDHVYDVDWNDMELLVSGELEPNWSSYEKFLEWYYQEMLFDE